MFFLIKLTRKIHLSIAPAAAHLFLYHVWSLAESLPTLPLAPHGSHEKPMLVEVHLIFWGNRATCFKRLCTERQLAIFDHRKRLWETVSSEVSTQAHFDISKNAAMLVYRVRALWIVTSHSNREKSLESGFSNPFEKKKKHLHFEWLSAEALNNNNGEHLQGEGLSSLHCWLVSMSNYSSTHHSTEEWQD